ncbi:P-loop containing nucleoside triphosphate hydrolase protein [Pisolithus croceorrhizus]|nr:P-loop containing nucleoside triphosphate hydrolase protein [Pisolithus croceorrhizus]KAI6163976.1 P-loop containing nucleoside triphosphate hydrolase protein [Pisolithus thermaeus]
MPRRARVEYASVKSSLVHLPISLYGPLVERSVRPQSLAVHLKGDHAEAYVGWTGMASASSLAHFNTTDRALETVEIDPQFATSLGFSQGDVVEIGLLHDLSYASSVATEPITPDDWDIVETHASHVESTLLSQVRVAKVGQEIDVWVLGRTRVRLKVVSLQPSTKNDAALLTTDTEVSIAPKTHRSAKAPVRQVPTQDNSKQPKQPETVLRLLPLRLIENILPSHLEYTDTEPLAYVHPYTFSILAGTKWPSEDQHEDEFVKLSYRYMPPPSNPLDAPRDGANAEFQGRSTDDILDDKPVEFPEGQFLFVGCSHKVLESHAFFPSGLQGVGDWHWIHVRATGERKLTSDLFTKAEHPRENLTPSSGAVLCGVEQLIKEATNRLLANFVIHSQDEVVRGTSAILMTGRPGVGRTSAAREIARRLEEDTRTYAYIHYVDFKQYSQKHTKIFKKLFRHLYEIAAWHRPTVLIFDNLDKILSPEVEHADSFRFRIITELFIAQFSASARSIPLNFRAMVMIGIAESKTSLHPLVHTLHIFQEIYHIQPPSKNTRKEILANLVKAWAAESPTQVIDPDDPPNYAMIAVHTEGYAPIDLQTLMKRAVQRAASRAFELHGRDASQVALSMEDFTKSQEGFVPNALKDLPLSKSDVEWADIGGLKEPKRILRETMEWPTKYAPLFKQAPLRLRSGILLYGYPGCGKTMLASAVSKECGLNFISIKGPELLNKYIGASEKSVRDVFDRASAAKPCVLFFDEFDSIAPKRGHDSTGVTDRVVNQLLTEMDGVEGLEGVFVLAATSRPDLIDAALLRPGRLDKSVLCDMPDEEDRLEILKAVSRKVTLDASVDFGEIAKATEGFSGADLQALLYNAHLRVVHAAIDASPTLRRSGQGLDDVEERVEYVTLGGSGERKTLSRADESQMQKRLQQIVENRRGGGPTVVKEKKKSTVEAKKYEITQKDLLEVLKTARPSVPRHELDRFRRIFEAFVSSRSRNKKVFPSPANTPGESGVGTRVTLG